MIARREFRHHAAEHRMRFKLRREPMRDEAALAVVNRGRGVIA